ncbi:MAG: lysophospholipid acyltransferase family protein [Deltaproteobacteria bacterium]
MTVARRVLRTATFGAVTGTMLVAFESHAALAPSRRDALWDRYRSVYLDRVLDIFGVEAIRVPAVVPPARGPRLVVANHRSALDIALLLRHFGGHMLSRADLAKWPGLGVVARTAGTIFVDRSEGMKRAGAARVVRRRLAAGATITVFPEGTTHRGDEVRPFSAGLFAAAKGIGCEVVPVGIAYEPGAEFHEPTFVAHLGATASRARTRVAMVVGEGMLFEDDSRAMALRSHDAVQALVHRARALL